MKEKATLYNRLKPSYLGKLVEQREKLPNMVAAAERAMNENVWVPMTLNGMTEFLLDAESLWNRESISGQQYWTGLHFTHLPDESRQCIERMVASR